MRELNIQVTSFEDFADQLTKNARLIDAGEHSGQPAVLSFSSMEALLKVLTPNRWALLENLGAMGPCPIRSLSQHIKRDYRGVHADIQALLEQELIERDSTGKVNVPWQKITATFEIRKLAA
jgi:predicted transcriptional regulator